MTSQFLTLFVTPFFLWELPLFLSHPPTWVIDTLLVSCHFTLSGGSTTLKESHTKIITESLKTKVYILHMCKRNMQSSWFRPVQECVAEVDPDVWWANWKIWELIGCFCNHLHSVQYWMCISRMFWQSQLVWGQSWFNFRFRWNFLYKKTY